MKDGCEEETKRNFGGEVSKRFFRSTSCDPRRGAALLQGRKTICMTKERWRRCILALMVTTPREMVLIGGDS
ncbi:unnamed protein product [Arabis nemorensis]|uniref:Uncharacterized protein n=1 Tax=Arabis nemorensis TaxID=586526 RepID=A0A565BI85_9BRAS|nr:unnamed protein product [Arabis nemorensis]